MVPRTFFKPGRNFHTFYCFFISSTKLRVMDAQLNILNHGCTLVEHVGKQILEELKLIRREITHEVKKLNQNIKASLAETDTRKHQRATNTSSTQTCNILDFVKTQESYLGEECQSSTAEATSHYDDVVESMQDSEDNIGEEPFDAQVSLINHHDDCFGGKPLYRNVEELEDNLQMKEVPDIKEEPYTPQLDLDVVAGRRHSESSESQASSVPSEKSHYFRNKVLHECVVCKKLLSSKQNLNNHLQIHTKRRPFKCAYCTKTFILKSGLVVHTRKHTGEKPFKCNICQKSFKTCSVRKIHMRLHTGEKPYQCSFCDRAYTQKGNLLSHMRTNHSGEKPYQRKICDKAFTPSYYHQLYMSQH